MGPERFAKTDTHSFFGEFLYDQVVPQDHFLRKLREVIDWDLFSRKLIRLYKGEGLVGRPPFDPALVLKVELIAYLYILSERQVEVYINENLPAKFFLGLAVDQKAPDHSTLTVFRARLLQRGKLQIFEDMLADMVQTRSTCTCGSAEGHQVWFDPDRGQRANPRQRQHQER
jgi:hypothetical protein